MMKHNAKAEVTPASPAPVRRTRSTSATHSRKANPAAAADVDAPVPTASAPAEELNTNKTPARSTRKKAASEAPAITAVEFASVPVTAAAQASAGPVQASGLEIDRDAIARLAYSYWEARGHQGGSQDEDWFRAEQELRQQGSASLTMHA